MKLIIEARLEGDGIETAKDPIPIAVIDRHDDDLEQLGLSLAEGRELLAATQSVLVSRQVCAWVAVEDYLSSAKIRVTRCSLETARHCGMIDASCSSSLALSLAFCGLSAP